MKKSKEKSKKKSKKPEPAPQMLPPQKESLSAEEALHNTMQAAMHPTLGYQGTEAQIDLLKESFRVLLVFIQQPKVIEKTVEKKDDDDGTKTVR